MHFFFFTLVLCPCLASEKVTLQLAWKHQFQFAGYYAALHKGYYEKAGLDVEIVEGGEGKFAREVQERKEAERALVRQKKNAERYLSLAGVMFIGLDKNGNINLANKKACNILEYSQEELIGRNWFDHFIPHSVREEVKAVFKKLMTGKFEPVKYYENPVISRSGNEKIIGWYNAYLTDDHGDVNGILSSGEDLSEKRQLQAHLLNARRMESIGNLAGGVAHEFNNILSIIMGNNELIMEELPGEGFARESAQEIQVAGKRARVVVRQLLTFSRQDNAKRIPIDIRSVVSASIALIHSSIPANILIKADLDRDVATV